MGIVMSVFLAGQGHSAQDGDQDQDGSDFEGQQQIFEENLAQVAGGDDVVAEFCLRQMGASAQENKGQQANDDGCSGDADNVGRFAAMGTLFFAGVEQHDDEGEEHHN